MSHTTHLDFAVPAAYQSLIAAGLDLLLVELVRIRSSQLNGCAFCLRMHTRDALAHGESTDRLAVLPAWRDSDYFSPAERAALSIAEEVTLIGTRRNVPLAETEDLAALTEEQRAVVGWLTIVINAFNRVAIVSRYDVAPATASRVN
jgi:AhpD family alkylhydroperoxidase